MTVEIRPITADEYPRFRENVLIGFSEQPREPDERPPWVDPEMTLCAFDDGELATTYAALPYDIYLNGKVAPVAAVTAVTTLPWQRRRGHLRAIMATDFARMHDQGGPAIALLYASMAAIYQRFGYAIVSTHLRRRVEPRYIEFAVPEPVRGRYGTFKPDDRAIVEPVYETFAERRTGFFKRTPRVWERHTLDWGPKASPLCVTYEEDGAVQGYLIYMAEQGRREGIDFGPGVNVRVGDFIWLTPSAYRALWEYLAKIDLAKEVNMFLTPPDDPAMHLFLEPRMLYSTQLDGLLARIVDVERAVVQRNYDGEGRLTFEILDDMAPWNQGRWELEAANDRASVRRTERTPELSMPVATLAPLLFGQFTASQAARMGRVTVHDPDALGRWDALLRTEFPPACGDHF